MCAFCGGGPLTLEHVFPQSVVPLVETLGQPLSAARVTQHEEHLHDVWNTSKVDLRRTNSRCHRSSVRGVTTNAIHRFLGRILLAAASSTRSRLRRTGPRARLERTLT